MKIKTVLITSITILLKMRCESGYIICAVHIIYHKGTQNMMSCISKICCLAREYIDKELSKHS